MIPRRWFRRSPLRRRAADVERSLDEIYARLAANNPTDELTRDAEWLLDNFSLIRRASRHVRDDCPESFERRLPVDEAAPPSLRILSQAEDCVSDCRAQVDLDHLATRVATSQLESHFTIAEIWALPTMLRLALLEQLVESAKRPGTESDPNPEPNLEANAPSVGDCVRSLLILERADWRDFFEKVSLTEQVLRQDPAEVYPHCDFATRDTYRKRVEEIARRTIYSEEEVARSIVNLASNATEGPRRHVGEYLIGSAKEEIERATGYRRSWRDAMPEWLRKHASTVYLGAITTISAVVLIGTAALFWAHDANLAPSLAALILATVPAISVAVAIVNASMMRILPPSRLPKLRFRQGIPDSSRTLVAIPALLTDPAEVDEMLQRIEIRYLGNRDPNLAFAFVTDLVDADKAELPTDAPLVERASRGVEALNARYSRDGSGPFYLFHRHREWNASERRWIGWERKRGKLEELNALLLGATKTTFSTQVGGPIAPHTFEFVITLDADTELPRGTARRLIETIAHPLNRARVREDGSVHDGYTVLQPRIEISPGDTSLTPFARLRSGDGALDPYSRAISDVYQDLFGEGIYVGKGIYDLAAFRRTLADRVPENSLLSHDLFEGIHGRAGLVSDIILLEDYPEQYLAYSRRMHRWARGDWQLLPWLRGTVPLANGERARNRLTTISRWKIVDNLRRALLQPSLVALLALGWFALPIHPVAWMIALLLVPAVPPLVELVAGLAGGLRRRDPLSPIRTFRTAAAAWLLDVVFLAHEGVLLTDACLRTLWRLYVSRRNLLEWTTAAQARRQIASSDKPRVLLREMAASPALALVLGATLAALHAEAFAAAAPLLVAWLAAPLVARRVSQRPSIPTTELSSSDRRTLRGVAYRTWAFFEEFVGPDDQWLPPDHYQQDPLGRVAHRTSPTNMGLMTVATLSAYDLGYGGPQWVQLRLASSFRTFDRMRRHRGHFLNWYDTRTLEPLEPRYVSAVDSGNMAANLVIVKHGCLELTRSPLLPTALWDGVGDALAVLHDVISAAGAQERGTVATLGRFVQESSRQVADRVATPFEPSSITFLEGLRHSLDLELERLATTGLSGLSSQTLKELQTWCRSVERLLDRITQEARWLIPWWQPLEHPPAALLDLDDASVAGSAWSRLHVHLSRVPSAIEMPTFVEEAARLRDQLAVGLNQLPRHDVDVEAYLELLSESFATGSARCRDLVDGLEDLSRRGDRLAAVMDFSFLYDPSARLLHIGYNASRDELDPHHYDLFASEARLASYLAIAKGDVPEEHWLHLGRRFVSSEGNPVLMSWSATMFEYLMPPLFLRQARESVMEKSCEGAVQAQIAYGRRRAVPWGISESAYFRFDPHHEYQYQAFGVPGLGFKRGLEDDLVIAPYASMLALSYRPDEVLENLERLRELGARGRYGLFEAVDFTPRRLPPGADHAVVQTYMAHHQGMILCSLDNFLNDAPLSRRFHADPMTMTAEFLTYERPSRRVPLERLSPEHQPLPGQPKPRPMLAPWRPAPSSYPVVHLLSNGRHRVVVSAHGRSTASLRETLLFRSEADPSFDRGGSELYVVDHDDGRSYPLADSRPSHGIERLTTFYGQGMEIQHRVAKLSIHERFVVVPDCDVDLRHVVVANEDSWRARRITLVSYAEPVLNSAREDSRHPAFSKLFLECEEMTEPSGLLFRRRTSTPHQESVQLGQVLVPGENARLVGFETSREEFFGRDGNRFEPASIGTATLRFTHQVGATLDAVAVFAVELSIPPEGTAEFTLITAASTSRVEIEQNIRRFQTKGARDWAFERSREECERELDRLAISASDLPTFQRLLGIVLRPRRPLSAPAVDTWRNRLGQASLWSHAISGDYPIVLVRVPSLNAAPVLKEVLEAQSLWRGRGLLVDVVILNEEGSGYGSAAAARLTRLTRAGNASEWLNRAGGVFLVHGDQIGSDQRDLLFVAARVILDGSVGTLASQLDRGVVEPPELPTLTPTRPAEPDTSVPRFRDDLDLFNGLGGFTPDGRSYVIQLDGAAKTPAPWANVVASREFGFIATEGGMGTTWAINSGEHRLTPWRNDPVLDEPAEVIYLRDEETTEIWSVTPHPAGGWCEVTHDVGSTTWRTERNGLEQTLVSGIPEHDPLKITSLSVTNRSSRARRITVTFYAEWVLGSRREPGLMTLATRFDSEHQALLAKNPWNADFNQGFAFVGSDRELHGFTTDRHEFLGPAGDLADPAALRRVGLQSREGSIDPCAALQVHLDLDVAQSATVHFFLGYAKTEEEGARLLQNYRAERNVAAALDDATAAWDRRFGITIRSPEPTFDRMVERWLPYQVLSSRFWGRTAFYQSSGAFGFRDQLQDSLALVSTSPEIVHEHLLDSAARQFEQGDVLHWWHPPSGAGIRTRCSDDLLWLPYVTAQYVAATGDREILAESIPFLVADELADDEHERYGRFASSKEGGSLHRHCVAAIDRACTHGPHGLPLIGTCDWNDGMNRVGLAGRGESVWMAWFLCDVLQRYAEVCRSSGESAQADEYERRRRSYASVVEEHGWDGRWYRRGYFDDGAPLGSITSSACQIDAISQSWGVLSSAANRERARIAMNSARQRLVREDDGLVLLLTPPFNEGDDDPGYIRAYPPGIRENGGQYTHASIWTLWAELELGDVDHAVAKFLQILPVWRSRDTKNQRRYRVEPYALAGDIAGAPPWTGRGGWTWYTGSAAWAWRFAVEGVLGITLVEGCYDIRPRLPSAWPGYETTLRGPFGHLQIAVRRSKEIDRGTIHRRLDDVELADPRLPRLDDGALHHVVIEIGRREPIAQTSRSDA